MIERGKCDTKQTDLPFEGNQISQKVYGYLMEIARAGDHCCTGVASRDLFKISEFNF
jgi:hypothetical protein